MMKRAIKYILLIFLLTVVVNFNNIALTDEVVADELIKRPKVEYKSGQLRDPFQEFIVKDKNKEDLTLAQEEENSMGPDAILEKLQIQGMIWGGKFSQAIINDKVLTVGDSIEGAQILSIDKQGVTLGFAGGVTNLLPPGQGNVIKKEN